VTSIYIHIPFCETKCGYCDFYSIPKEMWDEDLHGKYVDALCKEIECRGAAATRPNHGHVDAMPLRIDTIYFGGGTPSIIHPNLIEKILKKLSEKFSWNNDCEITLECNPGSVVGIGINRLSMGVQSFNDVFLKKMERVHSSSEARETLKAALDAGFDNFSLDLIFGLPGQTEKDWETELSEAISFNTKHISAYNLMIEEGTAFAKTYGAGKPFEKDLPPEDVQIKQFQMTREILGEAGLLPYEISNFAKPGFESRHNQNYWEYGNCFAFGAGAVSFVNGVRTSNRKNIEAYIKGDWSGSVETIDEKVAMGEFVFVGLRQQRGVSLDGFEQRFQVSMESIYESEIKSNIDKGLLVNAGDRLCLTPKGILLSDTVFSEFLLSYA
jgi:oxygen-independent coproporphyrinogen III oxidase